MSKCALKGGSEARNRDNKLPNFLPQNDSLWTFDVTGRCLFYQQIAKSRQKFTYAQSVQNLSRTPFTVKGIF